MFEFAIYESSRHRDAVTPAKPCTAGQGIAETSLLIWGEHCIECAAPSCYETCSLYEARPDGRCRRFEYGAYRNPHFNSHFGYGAEIKFKKWAKLEARGNTAMFPVRWLSAADRCFTAAWGVANSAGTLIHRVLRDPRWRHLAHTLIERLGRRLHRTGRARRAPDAFLLEVYNPGDRDVSLQLALELSRDERVRRTGLVQISPRFVNTVNLPPGYSRWEIPHFLFAHVTDPGLAFDVSLTPEGEAEPKLVILTADFVRFDGSHTSATELKPVKCVVWDLDNTLWNGILVEGDDIRIGDELKHILATLDERGILLSVASKNDRELALSKLQELGVSDYFLYPQISWFPKSEGIKRIAQRLNLGLDSFAFVDDNPFELDEVRRALPNVTCFSAENIGSMLGDPRLAGSSSAEARNRRLMYKQAEIRDQAEEQFGGDFLAFLASCEIQLEILPYTSEHADRVAELVQRTNQLNFSGRKYTANQLQDVVNDSARYNYVLRCRDRYGDYGTVGFSTVRVAESIFVDDFMLSCRVQGKLIERAFFDYLLKTHGEPHRLLQINFRQTSRNGPARQVLETLGFQADESGSVMQCANQENLTCAFIHVLAPQSAGHSG